jgi:hypothetical protein
MEKKSNVEALAGACNPHTPKTTARALTPKDLCSILQN